MSHYLMDATDDQVQFLIASLQKHVENINQQMKVRRSWFLYRQRERTKRIIRSYETLIRERQKRAARREVGR